MCGQSDCVPFCSGCARIALRSTWALGSASARPRFPMDADSFLPEARREARQGPGLLTAANVAVVAGRTLRVDSM